MKYLEESSYNNKTMKTTKMLLMAQTVHAQFSLRASSSPTPKNKHRTQNTIQTGVQVNTTNVCINVGFII